MAYCTTCGKPVESTGTFCTNCGSRIGSPSSPSRSAAEAPSGLEGLLKPGERLVWRTNMRFVPDNVPYDDLWVNGELIFTDKRILWSGGRDIPYKALGGISVEDSPRSGGFSGIFATVKGGGTILVGSAVGNERFQFDDRESLHEAERLLREAMGY